MKVGFQDGCPYIEFRARAYTKEKVLLTKGS
jgi:hypothetical protein